MSYIGKAPGEHFTSFQTETFSVSVTTSYTLSYAVANENELALFINNVRQQPGSGKAYTASGTALTLSAATASTDTMYAIYLGRALQTITPSTNSITSGMLGSAFFTGATDVGAAIADADLFLMDDGAGGTLRKTAASRIKTYVGGGLSQASQWRLSANQTSLNNNSTITSNWEENDTNYSRIGDAFSESSGIFTFPETGIYLVEFVYSGQGGSQDQTYLGGNIYATPDNSTYSKVSNSISGADSNGNNIFFTNYSSYLFDVTNTTTHKVKFVIEAQNNGVTAFGNTDRNATYATFTKLGDT